MSHVKRREKKETNKPTRWDRIRKRQLNANPLAVKTDAVRRFIEVDYVDKRQSQLLIEGEPRKQLNPSVIMDMRHEMFAQIPRKLPLATVAHGSTLESTKAHNQEVEQRYVHHQLQKFRQQLARQHPRSKIHVRPTKPDFKLNHGPLMESLAQASRHIDEFYRTPVDALSQSVELCAAHKQVATVSLLRQLEASTEKEAEAEAEADLEQTWLEQKQLKQMKLEVAVELDTYEYRKFAKQVQLDESRSQLMQRCRTPSPLLTTEELLKPMRAAAERQMLHLRTVRHEEELQEQQQEQGQQLEQSAQPEEKTSPKLQRESSSCSNTSDGIDSVISDLAEEALYELQLEAAEQQQQQLDAALEDVAAATKHVQFQLPMEKLMPKPQPETSPVEVLPEPLLIRRIEPPRVIVQPKSDMEIAAPSSSSEDEHAAAVPHEKHRIIDQLFQARDNSELSLMRKYFLKWIHYTTMEKIERETGKTQNNRAQKINAFLDKIRQEKRRQRVTKVESTPSEVDKIAQKSQEQREEAVKMAKQFKNKLKVQQDIIDLQRIKLERQERLILQLKLNKLSDEAKEAREDLKQELKTVIRCGDPKAKAKAKCLQLIGSLRDAEDEELERLQGRALLQPRFLQHMQERALERSVRHEQARQRRAQAEAEREAAKLAVEEAKRQQDEEAKLLRMEVLKEKRRQEKMAKILKERERQRFLENQRKAQEFARRLLLRRVGLEAFKRLLQRKRDNLVKCEQFCRRLYKRSYFQAWRSFTEFRQRERRVRADQCYQRALKRRVLHVWLFYVHTQRQKMQVAIDFHALQATDYWFNRWLRYSIHCRLLEDTKTRQAISHHEWHLKWKVLDCWQRLPQILRLEKETEERRQRWRMKIWELLPDYKPREDSLW